MLPRMASQKYGWYGPTAGMLSHRVCTITVYLAIVYLRSPVHRYYEAERRRESYHFKPADSHPLVTVVKVAKAC